MGLETTFIGIGSFDTTWPLSSDAKSAGDDHIRGIKKALATQFPNVGTTVVTTSAAELNLIDGLTANAAELNILDGATLSTAELNLLDGVTASTTEINYVDGVTSAIQGQLDLKAPLASPTLTGTVTVPTPANATDAANKSYVDGVAMNAALPSQTGNNGKIVTTDGANASWTAIKTVNSTSLLGSGDVAITVGATLLSTVTASNSATVDIETTFDTTYDSYLLVASNIIPQTDSQDLQMRMKLGGSYLTTSTYLGHYSWNYSGAATYSGQNYAAVAQATIASSCGNATGEALNLTMWVMRPAGSAQKVVHYQGTMINAGSHCVSLTGAGGNTGTGALTGIRFYMASGNIASGEFRLYGMRKA